MTPTPIFIDDKDYEFSVDPELITSVESDPFHGYETETVVAHLNKLNDIASLFTHDEKTRYYFILKLFPFSLNGDAKAWYSTLALGCYVDNESILLKILFIFKSKPSSGTSTNPCFPL